MQNKKAISLIVLVITIIVMIILASAIIMSLDNTNIFNKAEDAVEITNIATNKYLSEIKLAERELEKIQGASPVIDTNPGELREEGNTCYIESIDDLVAFSQKVNSGQTYEGMIVKLTKLLDFNSDNSYVNKDLKKTVTEGNGFTPIGTESKPFKGIFDGDGAEIRNLYINTQEAMQYAGLFGYAEDASFTNVGVTGKINAPNCGLQAGLIGGIVATKELSITNCYTNVRITNGYYVAGIVSDIYSTGPIVLIQDCYNMGDIISDNVEAGGAIAGITGGGDHIKINRCYNLGEINYESGGIGAGIISMAGGSVEIINSYNEGLISTTGDAAGGIVGYSYHAKIKNSYNSGKVYNNCTNLGAAGICSQPDAEIENCYNIGEIVTEYNNGGEIVGNIVNNTILKNVYYNIDKKLNGDITVGTITNVVGKTISEMKSQEFVKILNNNIGENSEWSKWKLGSKGYPVLDI